MFSYQLRSRPGGDKSRPCGIAAPLNPGGGLYAFPIDNSQDPV
jgi:hypothetical protein